MAYELLYSRNVTSDKRIRWTDVPIFAQSIMVDAIALRSEFRRFAGYLYPITADGLIDYERHPGVKLLYGKTRIALPVLPSPCFLEYYPVGGWAAGIVSVYRGFPDSAEDSRGWRSDLVSGREFRLSLLGNSVEARLFGSSSTRAVVVPDALEGFVVRGFLFWKSSSGVVSWANTATLSPLLPIDEGAYQAVKVDPESVQL